MGPGPTNSNVDNFGVYRDFSKPFQHGMHMDSS
jgi:hypothetical protein